MLRPEPSRRLLAASRNGTRRSWRVLRVYPGVLAPWLASTSRTMRPSATWTIPRCFKRWVSAPPILSPATMLAAGHGLAGYTNREGGSARDGGPTTILNGPALGYGTSAG